MKTLKELAKEALQVQDACNLAGVAQSFGKAMVDLMHYTRGTAECNTHPIAKLWADKIAHLTGTQHASFTDLNEAYTQCHLIIDQAEQKEEKTT